MARPREPWRRERLLDAAVSAAATKGVGALTVKDVAESAGVSPGTIHYHFTDIEGVLLGVIDRSLDQMYDQRLAAITAVRDIAGKLDLLIELGVPDEVTHEVALMYEAVSIMRTRPAFEPVVKSYVERQVSLYRSVIDAGVSTGDFVAHEPPEVVARNLLALEDAYDLYRVVGVTRDGSTGRRNLRIYASRALGCHLGDG